MPLTRKMGDDVATLVPCGVVLRNEINLLNPKRDKSSDGWIADAAHVAAGTSDHIADRRGLVHAIDVDKDGIQVNKIVGLLVARCRAGSEKRIKYIIWNRTIWSAAGGWKARRYTGANDHTHHFHVSFVSVPALEQSKVTFGVAAMGGRAVKPTTVKKMVAGSRALKQGSVGTDVGVVQAKVGVKVDNVFGPVTTAAVKKFQAAKKLTQDGIVGKITFTAMGVKTTL